MTRRRLLTSYLSLVLSGVGVALLSSCKGEQSQQMGAQGPQELPVRTLSAGAFSADNSYPAVIRGEDDAEIRPKVSGFITKVFITEGQSVRAGQPLFQLDDVTFRAAVAQASASLSSAQATLATAQLNHRNSQDLLAKNIISASNFEEVSNALKSAEANVAVAKAALTSARENLSYCTITSPVSGVVGSINYRIGNLVSPQSTSPLTQVSNTRQAYVYFSVSERELQTLMGGTGDSAGKLPKVRLRLSDGSEYPAEGTIQGVSGVVDKVTGAITLRVDFPNSEGRLRSGSTGTILVPTQTEGAILVPQTATVEMLHKKFVYTVDKDGKLTFTEITVSPVDDGQSYTVTSGLKAGDRILVAGTTGVKEGETIKPLTEEAYAKQQEAIKQQMMGKGASAEKH